MRVHANAKLGPAGRLALVELVGEGVSLRGAASACGVAVATAHRWWHRWLVAGRRTHCPPRSPVSATDPDAGWHALLLSPEAVA